MLLIKRKSQVSCVCFYLTFRIDFKSYFSVWMCSFIFAEIIELSWDPFFSLISLCYSPCLLIPYFSFFDMFVLWWVFCFGLCWFIIIALFWVYIDVLFHFAYEFAWEVFCMYILPIAPQRSFLMILILYVTWYKASKTWCQMTFALK